MNTEEGDKPIRIQRKRTKGWKMPENTVSVTRPGKWGNPFRVIKDGGMWVLTNPVGDRLHAFESARLAIDCCIECFRDYILNEHSFGILNINELGGKNLACFCPLDNPCHADVLLKLANNSLNQSKQTGNE